MAGKVDRSELTVLLVGEGELSSELPAALEARGLDVEQVPHPEDARATVQVAAPDLVVLLPAAAADGGRVVREDLKREQGEAGAPHMLVLCGPAMAALAETFKHDWIATLDPALGAERLAQTCALLLDRLHDPSGRERRRSLRGLVASLSSHGRTAQGRSRAAPFSPSARPAVASAPGLAAPAPPSPPRSTAALSPRISAAPSEPHNRTLLGVAAEASRPRAVPLSALLEPPSGRVSVRVAMARVSSAPPPRAPTPAAPLEQGAGPAEAPAAAGAPLVAVEVEVPLDDSSPDDRAQGSPAPIERPLPPRRLVLAWPRVLEASRPSMARVAKRLRAVWLGVAGAGGLGATAARRCASALFRQVRGLGPSVRRVRFARAPGRLLLLGLSGGALVVSALWLGLGSGSPGAASALAAVEVTGSLRAAVSRASEAPVPAEAAPREPARDELELDEQLGEGFNEEELDDDSELDSPDQANGDPRRAAAIRRADRHITTGHRLMRQRRLGMAEAAYLKALEDFPAYPRAMAGLARVHLARRDGVEALRWARRLVARQPRRSNNQLLLGDAYALSGNRARAREAWRQSMLYGNQLARKRLAR